MTVGQAVLKLKTAWGNGAIRIVMLELMCRPAALVLQSRLGCRMTASRP